MQKRLFNKIVLFSVVIFLLILAPSQINLPNQSIVRAICTGLAIDTAQNLPEGVMLTAQIVIPEAGGQYAPNLSIVTTEGADLLDAFTKMDYQIGKKVRLAHCCFILIGYEISQQNLAETLDYLVRGNNSGNNTLLVHTRGLAKDVIALSSDINSNEIDNIQTIVRYNEQYASTKEANLRSFYNDYLSPHGTSIMSCINIRKENTQDDGAGGGGGGDSVSEPTQDTSSSGEKKISSDKIDNQGEIAVFVHGKLATILDSTDRAKFSWLDSGLNDHSIMLEHIEDTDIHDATMGFTITDKSVRAEFKFQNNIPCVYYTLDLKLRTEMITESSGELPRTQNYSNTAITRAMQQKVSTEVEEALKIAKNYGFDRYNFYRSFKIADRESWQKYLDSLPDPENYMQNICVFVDTKINSYGLDSLFSSLK